MRRITLWLASTAVVLMLLGSYYTSFSGPLDASRPISVFTAGVPASPSTPAPSHSTTPTPSTPSSDTETPGTQTPGTQTPGTPTPTPNTLTTPSSGTVTGDVVQTQWGPVQVEITVEGSTIAGVSVLRYPNQNPTDVSISNYALPILIKETMTAHSGHIDMVSGATYTSGGYQQSLQSALDKAGL